MPRNALKSCLQGDSLPSRGASPSLCQVLRARQGQFGRLYQPRLCCRRSRPRLRGVTAPTIQPQQPVEEYGGKSLTVALKINSSAKRSEKGPPRHSSPTKHMTPAEDSSCSRPLAVYRMRHAHPAGNRWGRDPHLPGGGERRTAVRQVGVGLWPSGAGLGWSLKWEQSPAKPGVCAGTWRAAALPCQPGTIALFC